MTGLRILVDAMPAANGGIHVYAKNLLAAWALWFPEDDLHVLSSNRTMDLDLPDSVNCHLSKTPPPGTLWRPALQSWKFRTLNQKYSFDAGLIVNPTYPVLSPSFPTAAVVHDFRDEILPGQFGLARRFVRKIAYARAYSHAHGLIFISERTRRDAFRLHPRTSLKATRTIYHGADHTVPWKRLVARPGQAYVVAFGHHVNKNADRVVRGWQTVIDELGDIRLCVVGLNRKSIRLLRSGGSSSNPPAGVELRSYLPDKEFNRLIANSSLILYPTDFEGFGLPALEGMAMGIPVVTSPDEAIAEVTAGLVEVIAGFEPRDLADAISRALQTTPTDLDRARLRAEEFTWKRCASETRQFLADLVG